MSKRTPRGRRPESAKPAANPPSFRPLGRTPPPETVPVRRSGRRWAPVVAGLVVIIVLLTLVWRVRPIGQTKNQPNPHEVPDQQYLTRGKGTLTFAKDVAPILFKKCAVCHRPDEAAPFSLLTYEQARKHARQIADVTARRFMPPWPPEPGYGEFADERRLTAEELGIIQQWVAEGTPEGISSDLPPTPAWADGWQLGKPDLTVAMPEPYVLPADGKDVYRNFVMPISVPSTNYVRAVEFRAGNARVVHHAFIEVDETRQSRHLAEQQKPPGFDGMELPDTAIMPAGQFLGWQPGKSVYRVADGLAWTLNPTTDLVLQMHMHPSGKPELVMPSVGFYFTDQAPTNLPFRLRLLNYELDIPAGMDNYIAEQSYVLPVETSLLRVNPHAHYLGKDLQGYALLPNGEKKWLLWIKNWDFNWQGDYQYAHPVVLPKGSKIVMRYTYDNSAANPRNPNQPPKRVRHGINTTDEMAALGFQALTASAADRETLIRDYQAHLARILADYARFLLRLDPTDATAHTKLAWFLFSEGKTTDALEHVTTALKLKPGNDQAHYELGYILLAGNRLAEARQEFQTVTRLNPRDAQAYGNLGYICMKEGRFQDARRYFEQALQLNPGDRVAQQNLDLVMSAQGKR